MTDDARPDRELHPAEIAKLEAEAEVARALARKHDAEAAKFADEGAKARAEMAVAQTEAEADRLRMGKLRHDAEREDEKRAQELSADEHHHVYYFKGEVSAASTDKCHDQLRHWDRTEEPGNIEIVFFSPGGSVLAGMALFDAIEAMRAKGWHFTTICRGYAASMGGILLQAGDTRVCGPESYILIHEISSGAVGKIGELEDEIEFVRLIQKRVNDIFVRRSGGKVTSAKLRSMYRRKDFWLDSANALKLGIIDEVR